MTAPLAFVPVLCHEKSGPNGACNTSPALTDNERGRFAMAPDSHTQNPSVRQEQADAERAAMLKRAIDWERGQVRHAKKLIDKLAVISVIGPGQLCLENLEWMLREAVAVRLPKSSSLPPRKKAKIAGTLRKRVFERDAYRCVSCGTHIDLSCDHIVPESKGGPTTLSNLQTMCLPCNMRKGARL